MISGIPTWNAADITGGIFAQLSTEEHMQPQFHNSAHVPDKQKPCIALVEFILSSSYFS